MAAAEVSADVAGAVADPIIAADVGTVPDAITAVVTIDAASVTVALRDVLQMRILII